MSPPEVRVLMLNNMRNVSAVRRSSGLALKDSTFAGAGVVAGIGYPEGLQGDEATNPDAKKCLFVAFEVIDALGEVSVGPGATRFEAQGDALK